MLDLIGAIILIVFAAFLIGIMVFYAVIVLQAGIALNKQLAENGVEIEGEIVKRVVTSDPRYIAQFYIHYSYTVPTETGETTLTAMEQIWFFEHRRYPVGTKVRLIYDPKQPQAVRRAEKVLGRRRQAANQTATTGSNGLR